MLLEPVSQTTKGSADGQATLFTNQISLQVYVILSEDKKVMLTLPVSADDKAMAIAEQIADLFGETKYSISFFMGG
jgi:hypothetical protein